MSTARSAPLYYRLAMLLRRETILLVLWMTTTSAFANPAPLAALPGDESKVIDPSPHSLHGSAAQPGAAGVIDPDPVADKLIALRDEFGAIYLVPTPGSFENYNAARKWVFFGNANVVYQQRAMTISEDYAKTAKYEWEMWAPRAGFGRAHIKGVDKDPVLDCGGNNKRALTKLSADETRSLLKTAKLFPPLWNRQAKFLARDEAGTYYYIDEIRPEYGGNGHHIYVGAKGAAKRLAMTNVVSDSEGDIFATKNGQLKIITSKGYPNGPTAFWMKGKHKTRLTILPLRDNEYLIYRDLAVYGTLGIVCDDL